MSYNKPDGPPPSYPPPVHDGGYNHTYPPALLLRRPAPPRTTTINPAILPRTTVPLKAKDTDTALPLQVHSPCTILKPDTRRRNNNNNNLGTIRRSVAAVVAREVECVLVS
ncbi:hypothetical protein P175DRAFT_0530132 [Aspergillus ochraceoroseus IBT 24754]|uniref:Uncharacterized protein n=1 Tax=Aspergillus ochraceoroseus IBT 24754 TaxID=1392256 RepID=A0A2T5M3D4_9EURO|nr:uncharacterized protein P175DRAFT_0530132 [Aspergillus ochraceoroseus IBT 24754]PTU23040.1 hypothetical protein P175DRAFT_0530132 [Aspergillus ochraceoroseus IBT 24754]